MSQTFRRFLIATIPCATILTATTAGIAFNTYPAQTAAPCTAQR